VSKDNKPVFILLKIQPNGKVEVMPIADSEKEFIAVLAAWKEVVETEGAVFRDKVAKVPDCVDKR
jgi:hypothetical protein